tara:strand:- start:352 stop:534 length:183 start_codon:yes stop_codon:yes gene_type:complete
MTNLLINIYSFFFPNHFSIIQEAQDAANNETKSSAVDKHEAVRAIAQLETEKYPSNYLRL